jgi:DNA uptake protein ComE-like DNA-binding protein
MKIHGQALQLSGLSIAALWMVVTGALAAQSRPPAENLSTYLPPGDGRERVARICSNCHDLKGTLQLRQNKAAWEAVVLDMGARGAQIELDDIDPIVSYLAAAFGPDAPPFVDVNTDPAERLTKIPGITPAAADALIAARAAAPLTSAEQVRAALKLDAAAFDKVRFYLYVKGKRD